MSVAVVSSSYGGYDNIDARPEQSLDAEWIMVTDNPELDAPGWNVIVEKRPHMHPRLAAKVPKCVPFTYTNADTIVWMDASCRLLQRHALASLVEASGGAPLGQVTHPWRDCIYDEAEASIGMPKYDGQPIREQVAHYKDCGYPVHGGLFATGLIVRNKLNDIQAEFGYRWLAEQVYWSYQDQLSQMPILASMRLQRKQIHVTPLPFALHGSGVFEWRTHTDGT